MFAVAPTDLDWFRRIQRKPAQLIANFWTPTPRPARQLSRGDRLYFLLKAPVRKIGGYGKFVRSIQMPAIDAWVKYGLGNGVDSQSELVSKVETYAEERSKHFNQTGNPIVECIELMISKS